ncbi:MAG: phosphoribosylanthranilate isomerase [Phycisphaerae bacterium]
MRHTRIKICGITRPEDAALAAELGVDFIGLNFVAGPRKIDLQRAQEILAVLPPGGKVTPVALVRAEHTAGEEYQTPLLWDFMGAHLFAGQRDLRTFQTYGPYPLDRFVAAPVAFSWWLVRQVESRDEVLNLPRLLRNFAACPPQAIVLDALSRGHLGGTGQSFDWNWLAAAQAESGKDGIVPPIVLAGGLKPENVAEAVRLARPYAVDLSSGVESGRAGIKDAGKMRDFVQAVRGAGEVH